MPDKKEWSKLKSAFYALTTRNPASNRLVVDLAGLSADDHTLDIGCGPGAAVRQASRALTSGVAVGVDRSQSMVEIARRRSEGLGNVQFEVGSAEALPFPADAFTVAWTVHAFHHWADPQAGLTEVLRVLAPGGRLIIVERRSSHGHGLSSKTADELRAELQEVGFADVSVSQHRKEFVINAKAPLPNPAH